MCNIAGYIGTKQAMPILIEMMSKEEGWDSGFFTGYATMDQGQLFSEKVVGDLKTLLHTTNAHNAPGTVGIMHSRTPGKPTDDFQYAHPYIGDGERQAYVYNCSSSFFAGMSDSVRASTYQALRADGCRFRSERPEPSIYSPNARIGISELISHANSRMIQAGTDAVDAMETNICRMPMELASLMVSLDEPDCIFYSKTTYPMFLGIAPHGTYLATTPQAFPEDTQRVLSLDSMTGGRVYCDRYTVQPYKAPPAIPAAITPSLWKQAYEVCTEMIRQQPRRYPELEVAVRELFKAQQPQSVPVNAPVVYSILYELEKAGKIQVDIGSVPGKVSGTTAPKFYAHWVE